ncbi:hypothetical protein EX30DRAFT_373802 [Ascodesmis nigricans]|uniref:BZIP domain-containing protein n=1 Tax=Ascodesmis nigricans TaxID=341454 RepID=A0A4V6RHC3_9PEZI|nr:hypothetical protein EX30DRAFT_373802 [Ascodesmis nigricans]
MNSTFELDHFLDLNSDAFAPSTPPATTSEAASQAPFTASSSGLSPRPKSATTVPPTTTTTTTTTTAGVEPTATTTSMTPEFPAPSHPYHLHPQQTMPLMAMNLYGELNVMGLDNDPSALQPQSQFDFFSALQQSPALSDASMGLNAISPLMTTMDAKTDAADLPRERLALPMMHGEERKMYQGIHSDMMMAQQEKMLRQREAERASAGLLNNDDAKINHIFNSLRARPIHRQPQNNLPLLDKQKKEQAEMDEDEKLLASEEGKKLSSKERRQLRNKVSARAFRSRRKEYISQLESEVNRQAVERQSLRDENEELRISLQRYEAFIRNFLKTPYFNHLLDDLTTTDTEIGKILKAIPEATSSPQQQQQSHQSSSSSSSHPLQPHHQHMQHHSHHHQQLPKFTNPAGMLPLPSQTQTTDEWPLNYTPSSANPNTWPTPSPQVYTLSLPPAPAISELDLKSDSMADIDDLLVADGFFPRIRNEKGVVDFSMLCDDEDIDARYEPESCDVPETVEELMRREKMRAKEEMVTMEMREQEILGIEMNNRGVEIETNGSRDLDLLFPGVGVNDLLERLERVAGGERVENVFNTGGEGGGEGDMDLDNVEKKNEGEMDEEQRVVVLDERMLGRCNKVIERAEGVYRRIGLMVV